MQYNQITPEILERMKKLRRAGYTVKAIAYMCGTAYITTKNRLAKVSREIGTELEEENRMLKRRIAELESELEKINEQ